MYNFLTIGKKVRKLRMKNNMSQVDLAFLIDVSPSYIGYLEKGLKSMSLETLIKVANVFKVTTDMEENKSLDNVITEDNVEGEPVFCHKCGTKHSDKDKFCKNCGEQLKDLEQENEIVRCPKCGSKNIEFVTYQASSGFDKKDACCGYLLCGPLGLLCGVKDKEEATTVRKCKNCCHEF